MTRMIAGQRLIELLPAGLRIRSMSASWRKSILCVAAVWLAAAVPLSVLAQSSAAPGATAGPMVGADGKPLAFDAASIRKNVDHVGKCMPEQLQATPDGLHMTDCPLRMAVGAAYVPATGEALGFVLVDRMVSMPDWMMSERYDINARISDADAEAWKDPVRQKEMLRAMLQTLLAERCKLVVHREMKDKPIYALVVGKNGPKLKAAEIAEPDAIHAKYPNASTIPGNGGMFGEGKDGGLDLYGVTIGTLALALNAPGERPVVDKTGLTGRYDIHLPRMQGPTSVDTGADDIPTIFTVVEQLGLKLETQKDQLEILVIDHIERPSEN